MLRKIARTLNVNPIRLDRFLGSIEVELHAAVIYSKTLCRDRHYHTKVKRDSKVVCNCVIQQSVMTAVPCYSVQPLDPERLSII